MGIVFGIFLLFPVHSQVVSNADTFLINAAKCLPDRLEHHWQFGALIVTYEYRIIGGKRQKCHLEIWITNLQQESLPGLDITDVPGGSNYPQRQFTCWPTSQQLQTMIRNVLDQKYSNSDFISCRPHPN